MFCSVGSHKSSKLKKRMGKNGTLFKRTELSERERTRCPTLAVVYSYSRPFHEGSSCVTVHILVLLRGSRFLIVILSFPRDSSCVIIFSTFPRGSSSCVNVLFVLSTRQQLCNCIPNLSSCCICILDLSTRQQLCNCIPDLSSCVLEF